MVVGNCLARSARPLSFSASVPVATLFIASHAFFTVSLSAPLSSGKSLGRSSGFLGSLSETTGGGGGVPLAAVMSAAFGAVGLPSRATGFCFELA